MRTFTPWVLATMVVAFCNPSASAGAIWACSDENGSTLISSMNIDSNCRLVVSSESKPAPLPKQVATASSRWKAVTTGSDLSIYFMDTKTLERHGKETQAWFKVESQQESSRVKMTFNCSTKRQGILHAIKYSEPNGSGRVIKNIVVEPTKVEYEETVPDSVAEKLLRAACRM